MENPKYSVNISYQPLYYTGQQIINEAGVTFSMPTYSGNYFIASMIEAKIAATGSSYPDALDNLLIIASASVSPGNPPINSTKTW